MTLRSPDSSLGGMRPAQRRFLPAWLTFYLLGSLVVSFLAGSSAATPLYPVYQAAWGFTPMTTTVVFGVYALAVLVALLTVGSLSDYIGRRPVLLVTLAIQMVVMVLFATAQGVDSLVIARVIQGVSTGAAVGAIGAGLLDVDRMRGTTANAVGPMSGTAAGAIVSGLVVQYLPAPTHLIYLILLGVFVVQFIGVVLMAETATPKAGALQSIRLRFDLPVAARRPMLLVVPVLIAAWSLAGFYGALAPALIRLISGSHSLLLGGLGLFILASGGGVTVLALRTLAARTLMVLGILGLILGVGVVVISIQVASIAVFFLGTVVAGAGFGAGFQGGIRLVLPLAALHERAGVLSVIYVVSYLAMGMPAVVAGFVVVHGGGVLATASGYGLLVMGLAGMALVGLGLTGSLAPPSRAAGAATAIAQVCSRASGRTLAEIPK